MNTSIQADMDKVEKRDLKKKSQNKVAIMLTFSSNISLLSSISRRVCRILMHNFSSFSISFLVCLMSLTKKNISHKA